MGYGSIVSIFDRLSVKTVLTNYTGSYIGFLSTLAFIAVCLIVLIPPVHQYFQGVYFESQFVSSQMPRQTYSTGDDIIIAMVFKNRKTGELANHTQMLDKLNSYGLYISKTDTFKTELEPCRPEVFKAAINPMQIPDCIMLPRDLKVDLIPTAAKLPAMLLLYTFKCEDVFRCNTNSDYFKNTTKYIIDLNKNYYFEYIFNSKVLSDKGTYLNQFHKIYSSEYDSPDAIAAYIGLQMSQKKYFMDDSILPWWNNRTYENVFWSGKAFGSDGNQAVVQAFGFYSGYQVNTEYFYTYRYYKKLDFILGMIGGAVFLIFLFFWVPCSYVNRTLQKMKNAQELLLTKDEIITTHEHLHKVQIPWYYLFTKWLPGNKTNDIIQAAQHEVDIVRLIKKMKVTHRNLRVKGASLVFKSKDVDLSANEPEDFIPDRSALENYEISLPAYQALSKSPSTGTIYETNPVALALTENNNAKIDAAMQDEHFEKIRASKYESCKSCILHKLDEIIKFFDVFGARPMLNAEPETSSCWGFFLTLVIITLACLTFGLTIKNMDSIKVITSNIYQEPNQHNYEMTTSRDMRMTFCVPSTSWKLIAGANKTVQITFFKQSKKNGLQELQYESMLEGEFRDYYQLTADDPFTEVKSQNCFRPIADQKIQMGGSYETINQAYFGVRLDPYCNGLPAECQARRNQTIADFLKFVNYNTYAVFLSENKYSPDEGRLISGIVANQVSESQTIMNGSLLRTETFFVSAVELLDDTDKSFLRKPPKRIVKTMAFDNGNERNQQRKGNPNADPAYVLEFRPNGRVMQVIRRSYKIDFLLGVIGGCFLFWYFFVHFFAKFYNSYKIRAKLAQVLHQEDGYDESMLVHFLYLMQFPSSLCCCLGLKEDIERVSLVDKKMQRDLNYLNLVKSTDTCYKLSCALHQTPVEKDLSAIYFRQKIDESEIVKPKRINELKKNEFEDDDFLEFDDENYNEQLSHAGTSNLIPENSRAINLDLEKLVNLNRSKEEAPLYDPLVPNKKENHITSFIKRLDAFRNPPELTLDGERQVRSIFGAIMFFILAALIIIVCYYFLQIYFSGSDFTVSHRRILDGNLDVIDTTSTLGELNPGIQLTSGQNFKFAIAFNKKDRYFPHNVSQYIGPIGIRMMQYTITKNNGQINETYEQFEMEPCNQTYFDGFLGPYDDKQAFANISLGYCLPDGKSLTLSGIPEDNTKKFFKVSVYNKYGNATGRAYLNSFWKIYMTTYYMSAPRMDLFAKDFNYQMVKFNFETDLVSLPIETNITLTKLIYTNKYYSRSRETYNDKSKKNYEREDANFLSNEFTRNVSFYYDGVLDHYTLDYPGGAELFGLVGGVIALFIFFFYNCVASFNEYRMKYLIGQRLYTFDKSLSGIAKEKVGGKDKGKKFNNKKIEEAIKKINNFNEAQLLLAWILNPLGYIRDNYNFNKTLRRVTLIIDKVENDINLYNVYKNMMMYKDQLDKKLKLAPSEEGDYDNIKLTSIFIKNLYNPDPTENHISSISKQAKKHKLSSYQQVKIQIAINAKIDPKAVLGDKTLNRAFGMDDGSSIYRGNMAQERSEAEQSQQSPNRRKSKKKSIKIEHQQSNEHLAGGTRQQNIEMTRNVDAFSIEDSSRAEDN